MPHTIRLRGPWNLRHDLLEVPVTFRAPGPVPIQAIVDRVAEASPTDTNGAVVMGEQSAGAGSRPVVELVRTFNRPTGLNSDSKVSLHGRIVTAELWVEVNQAKLIHQKSGDFRVDISKCLHDRNVIVIRCPLHPENESDTTSLAIDEVWLEID